MTAFGNLFGVDYDDTPGPKDGSVQDGQVADGFYQGAEVPESGAALLEGEGELAVLLGDGAAPLSEGGEGGG